MSGEMLELDAGHRGRARRLKGATQETHERLDRDIMQRRPFASREAYGRLLDVQLRFQRDLAPFYRHAGLQALIPGLESRQRLDLIGKDFLDLGLDVPPAVDRKHEPVDVAAGLGWLYVAEGSKLGAAFLLKEAARLGLSEAFGARHLAAAPEGRGRHWKAFVAALDAADIALEDEDRVEAGARDAFRAVRRYVVDRFG